MQIVFVEMCTFVVLGNVADLIFFTALPWARVHNPMSHELLRHVARSTAISKVHYLLTCATTLHGVCPDIVRNQPGSATLLDT